MLGVSGQSVDKNIIQYKERSNCKGLIALTVVSVWSLLSDRCHQTTLLTLLGDEPPGWRYMQGLLLLYGRIDNCNKVISVIALVRASLLVIFN